MMKKMTDFLSHMVICLMMRAFMIQMEKSRMKMLIFG